MASHAERKEGSGDSGDTATGDEMENPLCSIDTTTTGETGVDDDTDTLLSSIDATKILPLLQPPDTEEAQYFYFGLPSLPRLVGRASAGIKLWDNKASEHARWRADPHRSPWFTITQRALGAIGDHKILNCWSTKVQPHIITAIGRLPWTSVDVFRIGNTEKALLERPVVVWVGLEHDDVPWEGVALALRACRRVLDAAQLADVDCQLRVSKVAPLAGPPLLRPETDFSFTADLHFYSQPFTTPIGQTFFPFSNPGIQGTLGVYLRAQSDKNDDNAPAYALTCRHVGLPDSSYPGNSSYSRLVEDGSLALPMGIAGQSVTAYSLEGLHDRKATLAEACEANSEKYRQRFEEASALYDAIKAFEPEEACQVGTVCLSPPIGKGSDRVAWTRDWCLVQLDLSKFPDGHYPLNVVDLRSPKMTKLEQVRLLSPLKNEPEFRIPPDSLLRIAGVIPLSEIRNPPGPVMNAGGDECILVGKRGAVTGLTWGCPSELESTVRQCMPDGSTFISQEWAIHGSLGTKTVPFSAPGDSGAAVFGRDGRLGGFITRGTNPDLGLAVDITYATPAALVLEDVAAKLGTPIVLL